MMQVLLVTGGLFWGGRWVELDSTEVLEDTAGTWRVTGPLPSVRANLKAAVLDNDIFVFGENILCIINIEHLIVSYNVYNDDIFAGGSDVQDMNDNSDSNYLSDILQYNTTSHTWEEVGQMKEARGWHAVAVLEDVSNLCP